jgi:hypothetical protein
VAKAKEVCRRRKGYHPEMFVEEYILKATAIGVIHCKVPKN